MSRRTPIRLASMIMLSVLLAAPLAGPTSAASAARHGTLTPADRSTNIAPALRADGTFLGAAGVTGTIDTSAWVLVSDLASGEAPRFAAATAPTAPTAITATPPAIPASDWSALGSNGSGNGALFGWAVIQAFAVSGTDLYVGGEFNDVAGIAEADHIAKWDGTAWSALGSNGAGDGALTQQVQALAFRGSDLMVGGSFDDAALIPEADHIAGWNGSNWFALGSDGEGDGAVSGPVYALTASDTSIYLGGDFRNVGGIPEADNVVRWDGDSWFALGSDGGANGANGAINSSIFALVILGGDLIAAGYFDDAGGVPEADHVARWDGRDWLALGSNGDGIGAVSDVVATLVILGSDLYAGGNFLDAGGVAEADHIAKWDGTAWSALGSNGAGDGAMNGGVYALAVSGNTLFAGGTFTNAAGVAEADYVAQWDGLAWSSLGSNGAGNGALTGPVFELSASSGALHVGGDFNNAAGIPEADDVANWAVPAVPAPTVTSITPTSGPTAGGTSVTVTGTGFADATEVDFGGFVADSFTVDSATQISAVSPAGIAGTVDVMVTGPIGTSAITSADEFTYQDPDAPTVTLIDPASGPTAGGTTVTVTGTGFADATEVDFGGFVADSFTIDSATQISAVSPSSTGTVDITVTGPGGTSATSPADQFTYQDAPAPTVTSITPTVGPVLGGTAVTITGTGFSDATEVAFGGAAADGFTIDSATQISATSPTGTGTVDITISAPTGTSATSSADEFTYYPDTGPWFAVGSNGSGDGAITSGVLALAISDGDLFAGGGFSDVAGIPEADFIARWDGSAWSALGSNGAGDGALNGSVRALAVSGGDLYVAGDFTDAGGVPEADYVARWDGSNWSAVGSDGAGGGAVSGAVYALAVSGSDLYVGGNFTHVAGIMEADYIARWDGSAWFALGDYGPGSGALGNAVYALAVSGSDLFVGGTFINTAGIPEADYLMRWNGSTWSGVGSDGAGNGAIDNVVFALAVSGGNLFVGGAFGNAGGIPEADIVARWNGSAWSALGSNGAGEGALGSTVTALAAYGPNLYAAGLFSNADGIPEADHIARWNGSDWSALGSGGPGGGALGSAANALAIRGTDLYVGGEFSNAAYIAEADNIARWVLPELPPTVTSISPTLGPVFGGTAVTITGTGFSDATEVAFGGAAADGFTVDSDVQISATSPAGTGTVDVTVSGPTGTSGISSADEFSYLDEPVVSSIDPTSGPTGGGTAVTITGTGFTFASAVLFGGTSTGSWTVDSDTQISALSPAGTGTVDVSVTSPGGSSETGAADEFTYLDAPTVTSVDPTGGPTAGGTSVTISGTGFTGATVISFGGTAADTYTVDSDTQITATSPAGTGTVDVTVTTPGGTSSTSSADQFTYLAGATYVALAPTRLLDTRDGTDLSGTFNSGVARTFAVTGQAGVPGNAIAVTGNLTVTNQTSAGFVALTPEPDNSPGTSTLNFPTADSRANGVTIALGSGGTLSATYQAESGGGQTTDLIFDLTGYFVPDASGATYFALAPTRLLDTRDGTGLADGFDSGIAQTFAVTGMAGVPLNAIAVTGTLTVTNQTSPGFVALTPEPTNNPQTSTLNFPTGDSRANGVTMALGSGGTLSATYIAEGGPGASADLVFDVTGYFVPNGSGASYVALPPTRLLDTRDGTDLSGTFSSGDARTFAVTGAAGVPIDAIAVTGNLTVSNQTSAGFVALTPEPTDSPTTSTLNFPLGDNRANGVTIALGSGGTLGATYIAEGGAGQTLDLIFDVTGYFVDSSPCGPSSLPSRTLTGC